MTAMTSPSATRIPAGGIGNLRLLRGSDVADVVGLDLHRQLHGPAPEMQLTALVDACDTVGLAGRGGAGFPVARKLGSLRRGRRIVVVNAAESEPASHKDRLLLGRFPHLVLDGAALVAAAIGAREVYVAVHEDPGLLAGLSEALRERPDGRRFRVHIVHGGFVAGEGRAVLSSIDGRPAVPPGRRRLPTDDGVYLSNAETFAQLTVLAGMGPAAYVSVGSHEEPGTTLLTVGGAVDRPGVLEVPLGTPLSAVLSVADARAPAAVVIGGYHGTWLAPRRALPLSRSGLAAVGGTLGAGVVLVLDGATCGLGELSRVAWWLAGQSARQCGPCQFGLDALARDVADLARGGLAAEPALHRHAALVTGRGACAHPDGAARFLTSGLAALDREIEQHRRHGRCGRPIHGQLPLGPGDRP
jgi:NADH:ubiquinone oxidoreductase subunit F (NADH-binding)